jgi:diguanylate cyclase (GGDEF)-like protein
MGTDEPRVEELEARVRQLERAGAEFRRALTRLGDALGSTHDRPAMVSAVLETVVLSLGAERGVFYEMVAGTRRLRATARFGRDPDAGPGAEVPAESGVTGQEAPGPPEDIRFGEGLPGAAAETGEVVVAEIGDGSEAGEVGLAIPMRSGTQPFGVLTLYGRSGDRPFSPQDVDTVQTLVRQAETAIENTYLYEEARHLSLTDGLTGLWNWRHFEMRLGEELSRAVRFRETFSVVVTDLDGFKAVNDTHGHQTGHGVLVELARRVLETTREVDLIARLGGDEFGMLLPRTGLAGALRLAEKVRAAVGDEPFEIEGLSFPITMSLGVAAYPEHGLSSKDLMAAADAALYKAKSQGGNRLEHAKVGSGAGGVSVT